MIARLDTARAQHSSIFHVNCDVLISPTTSMRCSACLKHRVSLVTMTHRSYDREEDRTHPSSHTPYSALSTSEKYDRLRRMHNDNKSMKRKINHLQKKIVSVIATAAEGLNVDDSLHSDLKSMADDCTDEVKRTFPEGSFARLFWEEQTKASLLKNAKTMRWHPLFIKWCLYLRHLSGKAYEVVRRTGCIKLPSHEHCGTTHIIHQLRLASPPTLTISSIQLQSYIMSLTNMCVWLWMKST